MNIKHILTGAEKSAKFVGSLIKNNGSTVLMIVGGTLVVTAIVKGVFDGQKIEEDIKQAVEKKGEELTKTETATVVCKRLWPVAVIASVGVGCFVGAHIIDVRECIRTAAEVETLRRGYSELSEKYGSVQEAAKEVLSFEDQAKLNSKIVDKQIEKHPFSGAHVMKTGSGTTLYFEPATGQYFYADEEWIRAAVNKFNHASQTNFGSGFGTFNEWLNYLGLEQAGPWANDLGYSMSKGLLEITGFEPHKMENDKFAAALMYKEWPYDEYKTWY